MIYLLIDFRILSAREPLEEGTSYNVNTECKPLMTFVFRFAYPANILVAVVGVKREEGGEWPRRSTDSAGGAAAVPEEASAPHIAARRLTRLFRALLLPRVDQQRASGPIRKSPVFPGHTAPPSSPRIPRSRSSSRSGTKAALT